jgi:mycothiol synthase
LFLIIHRRTGQIVASASAHHQPIKHHRFGGELGWVAVAPDHRGKKLGAVTCQAAIKRLKEAGYSDIYLRTDDWRLPAIKTYLNLGWVPFLFVPGMKKRWENVSKELGIDFKKLKTIKRST